jgi:glycosyltransferase involved in cell wall biosynthesis
MNIALVHDALINRGGSEQVLQVFCEMFPEAPIYTSAYLPEKTYSFFKNKKIVTSPLQKLVTSEDHLKLLFPLANYFMQRMEIKPCDIILSSSTFCAKHVSKIGVKHFCYCYTPFRLVWNPESYATDLKAGIKIRLVRPLLPPFKKWDYHAAQKIYRFIAMTNETSERIKKYYHRESAILPPPIDYSKFCPGNGSSDYFLIVSRLEPYKKVDLVIKTFNELKLPLKVVGGGTLSNELKKLACPNVEFLGTVTNEELLSLYQHCIAVILPQKEDYGIVPLEANACGKPAICYGSGGVKTTMVPYTEENKDLATAIFFYNQDEKSLTLAIDRLMTARFNRDALIANTKRFGKQEFCENLYKILKLG